MATPSAARPGVEVMDLIFLALVALLAGVCVHGYLVRRQLAERNSEVNALQAQVKEKDEELLRLKGEQSANRQRIVDLQNMEQKFDALASQVLQRNQEGFLNLANSKFTEHMNPVRELLEKYRNGLEEMERNRRESQGSLKEGIRGLLDEQKEVREEASRLREALRGSAQARGRWGERSLQNVAELAGMTEYCDFLTQEEVVSNGSRMRPDMIIRMSDGGSLVVDAKTPLENYLNHLDADGEARAEYLSQYSKNLRTHIQTLGGKEYWRGLEPSPQFVVMYVPGDHFLGAALEVSPGLWEEAIERRVLLATPTIFLALVRTVAYGWQVKAVEENRERIEDLGKELYERLSVMVRHVGDVGKNLGGAMDSYNRFVASLESRVLPKARGFRDLGIRVSGDGLRDLNRLDALPRSLSAPELDAQGNEKEE